jgi:AraC family transcriptional regulator of arabinose operon
VFDAGNSLPTQLNGFLSYVMDYRIERAITLVEKNLKGGVRIDWLAHQLGVSTSYLQHLFKNETGTTLLKYQQGVRIERACRLLEGTDLSIKQIVSAVGGGDISHFVRDFRKVQGFSPKRYRLNFLTKGNDNRIRQ